jgi:acid phosphatase
VKRQSRDSCEYRAVRWRLTILGMAFAFAGLGALPALAFDRADDVPDAEHATFDEVVEYYDSGRFEHDANRIGRRAKRALTRQVRRRGPQDPIPAIVFDIDDTALSTYECQKNAGDFGGTELLLCVVGAGVDNTLADEGLPRIKPVYKLYRKARRLGVDIFFVTGRPQSARPISRLNLKEQGYTGHFELITYPALLPETGRSLIPYKSGERARIERKGYEILVNIGDQESDLKGGFANRKFLVPNPMYFTP